MLNPRLLNDGKDSASLRALELCLRKWIVPNETLERRSDHLLRLQFKANSQDYKVGSPESPSVGSAAKNGRHVTRTTTKDRRKTEAGRKDLKIAWFEIESGRAGLNFAYSNSHQSPLSSTMQSVFSDSKLKKKGADCSCSC